MRSILVLPTILGKTKFKGIRVINVELALEICPRKFYLVNIYRILYNNIEAIEWVSFSLSLKCGQLNVPTF